MKRILLYSLMLVGFVMSVSSCSKEHFTLFDDTDCVTTSEMVIIEVPITDIPGIGGVVKLSPEVYIEVTYWQKKAIIDVKNVPILDFEAGIVEAPTGTTVTVSDGKVILNVPSNEGPSERPIVIQVTAEGVTKQFAFIQKRLKYNVDVEIQ